MSPPENLTPVDKLEFLILVDNNIEWFSQLPPGFTHELAQHLSSPSVPIDPLTNVPLMDLDNFCCGAHGLSILIKTTIGNDTYSILLDGGPESKTISRNISSMNINLTQLDAIVLSHWHRDHSGGLIQALKIRQSQSTSQSPLSPLVVDLHPSRPERRGISRPPDPKVICCLPQDPTFDEFEKVGGRVELNDKPHEIIGRNGEKSGIGISGEIQRVMNFEKGIQGAVTWDDGEWVDDPLIRDERYVVVDVKGKGLVVFSSCSHAGICNVLMSLSPLNRPIYCIVGGLHLVPTSTQPARETVDFISRRLSPKPKYILPLHCTGFEPKTMLREKLGEGAVVPGGAGMKVVFQFEEGDVEDEQVDWNVIP